MSISVYSVCSDETEQINKNGYKLYIDKDRDDDENGDKLKFMFITPDGTEPLFNYIYNKSEVDALIEGGITSDTLKHICLSAVNNVLRGLTIYNALKYNETTNELDILQKNVKNSSNAIYELNLWNRDTINNIYDAWIALKDMIDNINECHCMDQGGFHDQFLAFQQIYDIFVHNTETNFERMSTRMTNNMLGVRDAIRHITNGMNRLLEPATSLLSPLLFIVSNVFEGEAYNSLTDNFRNIYAIPNKQSISTADSSNESEEIDIPTDIIDPNKEYDKMTIPKIDDPYKRIFDKLKPVFGTIAIPFDLEVNGLINGVDITDRPIEYFTEEEGYDYYYVKNESVNSTDYEYKGRQCYKLSLIDIPQTIIDKLKTVKDKLNVFRFTLRKNEIYDADGTYIKDFILYAENNKLHCPVITKNNANAMTLFNIEYVEDDNTPFIAFDKECSFVPFSLLMRGELSIMNLLPQNTITSSVPTIKCDIIDARNALKLHESNIMYFYKPTSISEDDEYYFIKYHIPNDYVIPINTDFVFEEFCFNNCWTLTWDGNKWIGNNIQCKSPVQINNIINVPPSGGNANVSVRLGIAQNEFNKFIVSKAEHTHYDNMFESLNKAKDGFIDLGHFNILLNDGRYGKDIYLQINNNYLSLDYYFQTEHFYETIDGYDTMVASINAYWECENELKPYLSQIKYFFWEFTIAGISHRLTAGLKSTEFIKIGNFYYVQLKPINNTIEYFGYYEEGCDIDTTKKDVVIKCAKNACHPVSGIDWDPSTNAFQFIIDQQYYKITPNPNAATTLYTDFNITSSKIITADNITTMRSDLNVVANTTDIISYDVQVLEKKVDNITTEIIGIKAEIAGIDTEIVNIKNDVNGVKTELHQVEDKVSYLEKKVNKVEIIAGVALGLSCLNTVLSVGNTLELAGNYVSIGCNKIMNLWNRGYTRVASSSGSAIEMDTLFVDVFEAVLSVKGRAATNNLDVIIGWCNKPHQDVVFDPSYYHTTEDGYNPDNIFMSYAGIHECCNYYRDTLKPYFKEICTNIKNQNDRLDALESNNIATQDLNNYPTVDEVNDAFEIVNDKISKLEDENKTLKSTIDELLQRIEALEQK